MKKSVGFTLIELIVVLAIIATLAAILITIVKPQQIFMNMRDTQRKSDLKSLSSAIDIYLTDMTNSGREAVLTPSSTKLNQPSGVTLTKTNDGCLGGATPTIFYSAASVEGVVGSGFTGARATNSRTVATSTTSDPPGWLPVPLGTSTVVNLPSLPLDPRNSNSAANSNPSFYYTFACRTDLTYELNANLENPNNTDENNDGGNNPYIYEIGPDKTILPSSTSTYFYPNL
jgi:prepilin-type N-terminal cleavage/methylation domain-containing protein